MHVQLSLSWGPFCCNKTLQIKSLIGGRCDKHTVKIQDFSLQEILYLGIKAILTVEPLKWPGLSGNS